MTYQIIPLDAAFDNTTRYSSRNINNQFTEGGIENKARDGKNTISHTRSITLFIEGMVNKRLIETFLKDRKGVEPFIFNPIQDSTENGALYVCSNFSFQRLNQGTWKFQAEFERVYRLA